VRSRLIGSTAGLAAVAVTVGCGMTGTEPSEPSQKSGRILIGDKSHNTTLVRCTQNEWTLTIDAKTDSGRAHALLQLGGQKPVVNAVTIENLDGLNGVSGGDVGKAEAALEGSNIYTITGTAVVTDRARPAQTTDMPFTIEAPC
jgi:ipoprotein LpqH